MSTPKTNFSNLEIRAAAIVAQATEVLGFDPLEVKRDLEDAEKRISKLDALIKALVPEIQCPKWNMYLWDEDEHKPTDGGGCLKCEACTAFAAVMDYYAICTHGNAMPDPDCGCGC